MTVPYELIGRAVVLVVAVAVVVVGVLALAVAAYIAWVRGFLWLSNRMYRGYDPIHGDEYPPRWKIRVAAVSAACQRFQFRKIPAVWREAGDIADDDVSFAQWFADEIISDGDEQENT